MLPRDTNGARPLVETSRDRNPGDASRRAGSACETVRKGPEPGAAAQPRSRSPDTVNKKTISCSDTADLKPDSNYSKHFEGRRHAAFIHTSLHFSLPEDASKLHFSPLEDERQIGWG